MTLVPKTGLLPLLHHFLYYTTWNASWYHALRHTHATRMFEGGMRELTLQKRLGHASPESTRIYTDVSDATVVAEYRQALGKEETK